MKRHGAASRPAFASRQVKEKPAAEAAGDQENGRGDCPSRMDG